MPNGISRDTFKEATAKEQRLILFDEIQDLKRKWRTRKRVDVGMIVSIILLAIKTVIFGK